MMTSLNRTAASDSSATATTTTTTTTGKKKFGKNLNKLTKPPAPPAASETSKANAASRNGLLLLSTNKRSSGSGPSNGLLASKPSVAAPLPSLGLQYESSTSTHDVLLGAVVGAAASRAEQTPDAWGVAAAANNSNNSNNNLINGSSPGNAEASEPPKGDAGKPQKATTPPESSPPSARKETAPPSSNWDEYGGRGATGRGLVSTDRPPTVVHTNNEPDVDSQQAYMAKLARERAERRRQEEAARAKDQKEKASQRLRALESKMEANNGHSESVVLEPLGGNNANTAGNSTPLASRTSQRTLYDPNRTYSSLVGGANGGKGANATSGGSIGSREDQQTPQGRGNGDLSPKPNGTPGAYSGPVIHLNSYEDRDRGEAPRAAAPRMLFDPKSGSMVAVPSREDNPRGDKRQRNKRGGGRGKNADDDNNNGNPRGNNKQSKSKNGKKSSKSERGKNSNKKNAVNPERKLPRTRGVLYARDDKGNVYCADGCDGDLGYGAHSVHGGRVRNPEAHAKFLEQQQQLYKEQVPPAGQEQQRDLSMERYEGYETPHGHNPYQATDEMLATGFSMNNLSEPEETPQPQMQMDWVKPNEKIELVTGMDDESPTLQATAREWAPSQAALAAAAQAAALPSLGSQDDSDDKNSDGGLPVNLEPRDNPAANLLVSINMSQDEDDDDAPAPHSFEGVLGLGFENIDSVIQSTSKIDGTAASSSQLDGVDFGALSLEPQLCGISANNHNNIFAFGSSATWGTGGDSNDWGAPMLPGSSSAGTIAGSRLFGGVLGAAVEASTDTLGEDHEDDVFLSLTTGIPGFLGTEEEGLTSEHMVGGD